MIDYQTVLKQFRNLSIGNNEKKIKIAVGGNCNTDFLIPGLQVSLFNLGFPSDIINLEYNSWLQIIQQNCVEADVWIIWLSSLGASDGGTKNLFFDLNSIIKASTFLINNHKKIVLILPEKLEIITNFYSPLFQEYRSVKNSLIDSLPKEVLFVDPDISYATLGGVNGYASRYWNMAKMPCHPDVMAALSWQVGNLLANSIKPQVKAIIVDLDNTLWGGIIGEDGVHNLLLDVNGDGRPFIQMQFFLKQLSEQGIPLCVVSKNNIEDAKLPFLTQNDMLLTLNDFVYFVANWEHKSKNIQEIANKLKLNLDSICFIDDSSYERNEVKTMLPTLIVPDLPEDPDERVPSLLHTGLFTVPILSKEDSERANYYKSDVKRDALYLETINFDQYLENLDMILNPFLIDETNIQRVFSLIHRTNQFNLTNQRHSLQAILDLIHQHGTYAYCYRLKDKFGDSGIISVLIAKKVSRTMIIDTFLMSCRVLNRKVEYAIFSHFIQWLHDKAIDTLEAEYVKTAKNSLVKDLYLNLGFNLVKIEAQKNIYHTNKWDQLKHPITIALA